MPTAHFEYTNNLNLSSKLPTTLKKIHELLVEIIKTDLHTCRSLITPYTDFFVGDGHVDNAFIQLTVSMLPGRTDVIKHKLGSSLYSLITETFAAEIAHTNTEIRVYLKETDIQHYYGLQQ